MRRGQCYLSRAQIRWLEERYAEGYTLRQLSEVTGMTESMVHSYASGKEKKQYDPKKTAALPPIETRRAELYALWKEDEDNE